MAAILSLIDREPGYEIIPNETIVINGIVNTQTTSYFVIQNNSSTSQSISAITLDGDLTTAGLSVYFPVGVSIPVGQAYQVNLSLLATSEQEAVTASVELTIAGYDPVRLEIEVNAVAESTLCTITPYQELYVASVESGVATPYNNIIMETNANEGMLNITCNSGYVTFGASPYGSSTNYKAIVLPNSSINIPVVIQSTILGQTDVTMSWLLTDTSEQTTLCSGTFTLSYTVESDIAAVCPLLLQNSILSVGDLRPQDSGTMIATLLLDRDVTDIGNFTVNFVLPVDEAVFSFVPQSVTTGLTWDDSNIGNNPKLLSVGVDSSLFTGDSIEVILGYDIPSEVTQDTIQSLLSANTVFNNTAFECSGLGFDLFLGVLLTGTAGGYETLCQITTLVDCQSISVMDISGYGADLNHDQADFSLFRKIIVNKPSGVEYVYSTHSPYDVLIEPANLNTLAYTVDVADGGVYSATLISIPTFSESGTYNEGDCVCILSSGEVRFFTSLENTNTGNTPINGVNWENYWQEFDIEDCPDAYSDTKYYVQWCELNSCMATLRNKVFCDIDPICTQNIFDNRCFQSYSKVDLATRMLVEYESQGWYDKMIDAYNLIKKLCDCSTC